jgi:hypothetical protein
VEGESVKIDLKEGSFAIKGAYLGKAGEAVRRGAQTEWTDVMLVLGGGDPRQVLGESFLREKFA